MTEIEVLAGDFLCGRGVFHNEYIDIETSLYPWPGICLGAGTIMKIFVVTEDVSSMIFPNKYTFDSHETLGEEWAEVTFLVIFKDGRSLLGMSDVSTLRQIAQAAHVRIPGSDLSS